MTAKSDREVAIEELKDLVRDFCDRRGWDPYHGPKDLAIGLVTESSELLEIFRFVPERECLEIIQQAKTREAVADELADSLYFILRFAQLFDFDLSECMRQKMAKNEKKYPVQK